MGKTREQYELIRANAERIRKTRSVYGGLIDFAENLLYLLAKMEHDVTVSVPKFSDDMLKTKLEEGFPLLDRWDFPVDIFVAKRVLEKVGEKIPSQNEELKRSVKTLLEYLRSSKESEAFLDAILNAKEGVLEEISDKINVPLNQLNFLGIISIKPSLRVVEKNLPKDLLESIPWRRTYCPVCGSSPSLLLLKEKEGKRFGTCSWCEHQWLMNRIECPYCENQAQESLGYFSIEDDEVYRIEYCDVCKHYYKTVDCRSLETEPVAFLEELTTLHLDMIAAKKGYLESPALSPVVYGECEK